MSTRSRLDAIERRLASEEKWARWTSRSLEQLIGSPTGPDPESDVRQAASVPALLAEIRDLLKDGHRAGLGRGLVGVVDDHDGDAAGDGDPVVGAGPVGDLEEFLRRASQRVREAFAEGGDVLVVTEPDLVAAIQKLLGHRAAPLFSLQVGDTPEGRSPAGSASADSAGEEPAKFDADDRRVDCRECHAPMTRTSFLLGRGLCVECEEKAKEESR